MAGATHEEIARRMMDRFVTPQRQRADRAEAEAASLRARVAELEDEIRSYRATQDHCDREMRRLASEGDVARARADELREIAAENRAAGRAEAAEILIAVGVDHDMLEGSEERGLQWIPEKVRELFDVEEGNAMTSAFDRLSAAFDETFVRARETAARADELDRRLRELTAARPERPPGFLARIARFFTYGPDALDRLSRSGEATAVAALADTSREGEPR